jgi:hypothetical protein
MKTPFYKIKLSQLYNLCNILAETKIHQLSYIKGKFLENSLGFEETLSFLVDLKIITRTSTELIPSKSFFKSFSSITTFKNQLLLALLSTKGSIHEQVRLFLVNFRKEKGEIFFNPTSTEKLKYSDIRNILIELEFIKVHEVSNKYSINPNYYNFFFDNVSNKGTSSETLKNKLEENDDIGLKAEEAIIEFELKRLTNILINKRELEHTSKINVLAGYDIKSFENYLDNNFNKIVRYIEVKAVSSQDYKFFWSRNEKETAYILGENYYLYLLPVTTYNTFDLNKIKIINDPYKNIYMKQNEWTQTEECISFSINIQE